MGTHVDKEMKVSQAASFSYGNVNGPSVRSIINKISDRYFFFLDLEKIKLLLPGFYRTVAYVAFVQR